MTSAETIRMMIHAMPQPALAIGPNERILAMNDAAKATFLHAAVGRHYAALLRQPAVLECIENTLADGQPRHTRYIGKSNAPADKYQVFVRTLDEDVKNPTILTFQDVSQEEGLGQMRRDFVANVSHELRSPLTALTGFIETLKGPAKGDANASEMFLNMMEVEANRMTRLVHDLLSLSKVESNTRIRPGAPVDLCILIGECVEAIARIAPDTSIEFVPDCADFGCCVDGDRDQLTQVFRNLIENAVKYGSGEVQIQLSWIDRDAAIRGPAVLVDIHDNGDGIEPHHLPRLTERFYRVDTDRSRAKGGTGLGLAIVKHVIGRHRGRLRISSVPGEGSVFSVILPAPVEESTKSIAS